MNRCSFVQEKKAIMDSARKNELLRLIGENGYVTVGYLAKYLYTSASTIRRNLSALEKAGYVRRSYGGVELCTDAANIPLKLRLKKNHIQKEQIAAQAAKLIQNHSVIFLDASSTCLHMAPFLSPFSDLTVYTNGLELCSLLSESGIRVYCLGGRLLPRSQAFAGENAIHMAQTLFFDQLFFSGSGYDGKIITDYSEAETQLRRVLLAQSKAQYFLYDKSKLGKRYPYIICSDSQVTGLVTDEEL